MQNKKELYDWFTEADDVTRTRELSEDVLKERNKEADRTLSVHLAIVCMCLRMCHLYVHWYSMCILAWNENPQSYELRCK